MGTSGGYDPYGQMFNTQANLGLAPTHGTVVDTNSKDGAVITVYGGTAEMRISRPK